MKKLIYSLSFALAFGAAANAVNTNSNMQRVKISDERLFNSQAVSMSPTAMEYVKISDDGRQAKREAATSAEDFIGMWGWSGRNLLQSVVWENEGILTIKKNEENPSRLIVTGLTPSSLGSLDAYYENGKLIIPNQFVGLNTYYNDDMWFWNYSVYNGYDNDGEPAYGIIENTEYPFYFTIDNGRLKAGATNAQKWNNHTYTDEELLQDVCIAASTTLNGKDQGFFFLCLMITGSPTEIFDFVEDEWQLLGDADFYDAWFLIYWENQQGPLVKVPLYYNKMNPATYLLYNPYGIAGDEENPFSFYGINISDKPTFLIFNIDDKDCVTFKPLVQSLIHDEREDELDPSIPTPFYCFNMEGYYHYVQNASKEEIIISFEQGDLNVSTFNSRTLTVNIYNPVIGVGDEPITPTFWPNGDDFSGYILLTENYMDGVESLLGEEIDAPAEYYNLQGVRVNNPEKGQLVIVRKGNKSFKQIVR